MNELPDARLLAVRLAAAFADAVLSYVRTGDAQGVCYDPDTLDFVAQALESGTSPRDVGLLVGERWQDYVGDVGMTTDPRHREFSDSALRQVIVGRLEGSGLFRKIALSMAADRVSQELEALRDEALPH